MKKSIGDNMIPKGWSFEQGLDLVKKAGYDGIELWLGDVPWFQMSTTDAERAAKGYNIVQKCWWHTTSSLR
jgi:sugar phosphate isomerase/epimerase